MTRLPIAVFGLAAWLCGGLGLRAWVGGRAYLVELLGSEVLADKMMAGASERPEALVLGMDPWTLLLAFGVLVSAVLVLLLLWPADLLLSRRGASPRARMLVGASVATLATAAALRSVHPILSLPRVPEGPRTVLNYACEAAGYGWINAIAYVGAIAVGVLFAWLGVRADANRPRPNPRANAAPRPSSSAETAAESLDGPTTADLEPDGPM